MKTWKCSEHGELESDEITIIDGQTCCNICLGRGIVREVEEIA
ncbi:MAG: hypothetical protein PVI03_06700 [Candidatus Thorarchaeota archaeon]|jgi:hypothetical protein